MLMSHLGRPTDGEPAAEFSMQPVADHLSKLLGKEVHLVTDHLSKLLGKEVHLVTDYLDHAPELADGDVVLLENCRLLVKRKMMMR